MAIDVSMFEEMRPGLIRFYEEAETRLEYLVGQVGRTAFDNRRAQLILQQIDSTIRALQEGQRGWADKHLPSAYRRGMDLTNAAWRLPVLPAMTLVDQEGIRAAVARTMVETSAALESVAPYVRNVWIDTQQRLVREQQLARMIAEGTLEGLGPDELGRRISATLQDAASQRLKGYVTDELRERLERTARGEVIAITGRDGKLRHYNLKKYGELVARTAPRQAATEGAIARQLALGGDLVTISVHSGSCPVCLPIQGKTYSLTGKTPGFPVLTDDKRPPIHPNCGHVLVGDSADVLEEENVLDQMRAVSTSDAPITDVADWQAKLGQPVTSVGVA
jgi:hypothetical protein